MSDSISREKALMDARPEYLNPSQQGHESYNQGWNDAIEEYYDGIEMLPSAEPKIYGNEHNCVLTMFGECSYDRSGCGSCEIVDKIREAINAEPKTGKWIRFGKIMDIGDVQELVCDVCRKTILWVDDHYPNDEEPKFCPNCGARMLGEDGKK